MNIGNSSFRLQLQQKTRRVRKIRRQSATMSAGFRLVIEHILPFFRIIPAIHRPIGKNPRALFPNRKPKPARQGKQLKKILHLTKKIWCSRTRPTLSCPPHQATEGKFIEDPTKAQAACDL
ncbi:MAG: hypothetical protein GXP03_05865 [Alphaproteobacteria bacterium]|nr:hypothetical protein [Alphaproteobacteria bacterium]